MAIGVSSFREEGYIDPNYKDKQEYIYRIYTERNLADTCRDPDDIVITELGYRYSEEDALRLARDFIRNNFWKNHTDLSKDSKGNYSSLEICSYGRNLVIEKLKIN